MARLVTIECDSNEVRIAVGNSGLTGVSLEHVVSTPLALDANEEIIGSSKTFEAIHSLLAQVGVRSGNAVFCVGRNSVELRSLTLPTVEKNELPDMVRFAAQRQFANVGENWPIDFVIMPSNEDGTTNCLAASINPALIDRIHKVVVALGLTLTQIVLRPMASATMAVVKQPQLVNTPVLLMQLLRDEADMAVLDQGHVVFMRNVRFSNPSEAASNAQAMQGEIKRTLIAAASQHSSLTIDQIRIWGSEAQHSELCNTLSKSLNANVESMDPLDLFDASKSVRNVAGDNTGKYASAIGALLAPQVADRLIDFTNPRKREEVRKPIVKYAILGGTAAALLIGAYGWYWMSQSALDSRIVALNKEIADNAKSLDLSNRKLADWAKVESFLQGDQNWLDELEHLSKYAAPADQAIFGVTSFSTVMLEKVNTSSISSKFVVKKQGDAPDFEEAFRDSQHLVLGTGVVKSQDRTGDFPWSADLVINLAPQKVTDPRKSVKAKAASDKDSVPTSTKKVESKVEKTEDEQTPATPLPATNPPDPQPAPTEPPNENGVGG